MKKKILPAIILTAAVTVCAACGSETPAPASTAAAETQEPVKLVTAAASEITAAVLNKVPISSSVEKGTDDLEFYFSYLDKDSIEEASFCMCASGAFPDEIAVIKFTSPEKAEAGLDSVKGRMEQQRSTYESYKPDEMYKFDGAVAETRGSYVVYLVTADNSAAAQVVSEYI